MPDAADAADSTDLALIRATQAGLPLVSAPFAAVAAALGLTETEVIARLAAMQARGMLRRIGAVPNHYRLGWRANGMTVWDVNDARVEALGERVGALPFVSHCYLRPRRLPHWPYNLFAMVHARTRADAVPQIERIAALLGDACRAHDVLWSTRILKKTGLRLPPAGAASQEPR
ncbi:AsnC family transcriptional regulator [Cupriavidus neocaledonicus]|uniref:siroheme decarboxylase n=1 Tax=Cupriavidus neocaledonicus TaxID=1040979 RepID=A0A375HKT6_9BURK|nr:AsnC family transcriptional regulator [Cupriavidus neocaledonicus]SOZ39426.1 Nitrite reductase heme d1 biosynthesis protein [Cupriavidus neocaledonicus]SPD58858.1 Protein NirH [Cupriavidus neocaledonicus]